MKRLAEIPVQFRERSGPRRGAGARAWLGALLVATALTVACGDDGDPTPPPATEEGEVWVANRGAGTISVIDIATDTVTKTITLPDSGEPMYVNYSDLGRRVFIGDRANNKVLAFDADTKELAGVANVGAGVFHQWISPDSKTLYVNNDEDKTTSIIDIGTFKSRGEIAMPSDLVTLGGKPHDVFVDPSGGAIFISYLGFSGENDYVVRFDAATLKETHRAAVGKDPHLMATAKNALLYVPCQETNNVYVLKRDDLSQEAEVTVPGAHGVMVDPAGGSIYMTNLTGGGDAAIYRLSTTDNSVSEGIDSAKDGAPHNLAITGGGGKLYLTHSGETARSVSVFAIDAQSGTPSLKTTIAVDANPFGLGFVPKSAGTPVTEYTKVVFNTSGLSTLRDGHHYEGWAIFDGQPVSTGKFNVDASGVATDLDGIAIPKGEFDVGRDLSVATAFVITIELPGDKDIVPNETHYLAGNIDGTSSILTATHADALGNDFSQAAGSYILATPTDGSDNNETSGVWFLSLQMASPAAGLALPTLPAGWKYEGWAVVDGKPLSTGKFTAVDMADAAAPFSETLEAAPPFPGEDFLLNAPEGSTFPLDLSEAKIVISIEPEPDDSPAPFLLKPLAGDVPANAADHQTFDLDNIAADFPVVTATLRE